ncbi:zinc finger protein with KRAB and SCAN domains 8-like isoform X1 [Chelonia mydas]|uniref:zinc finger protein with KRAB and SCAN domains 8-like isoform X1 n=1 Tax=Chelonia mydas TaxID=8469 RepID=UPI001CA8F6E3|nr:zinc finger protein with KRAB and SCAN domains 8-like isoform X1 [Chelonia mydas]
MGPADDPDVILCTFEQVAMGAGWDRATWALWLAPYLAGKVQVTYIALSEEQGWNYDAVKEAVVDWVWLFSEKYHQKFRSARWTGGLQPWPFAQRLMDWVTHWLKPSTQTVWEIVDMLVLEQFLQGLPESIQELFDMTVMQSSYSVSREPFRI